MEEHILDFIFRRFHNENDDKEESKWMNGNCFYFAVILSTRFCGEVYYDLVNGHFVTKIDGAYYDWTRIANIDEKNLVDWFEYRDHVHKERIIRDCIL